MALIFLGNVCTSRSRMSSHHCGVVHCYTGRFINVLRDYKHL